MDAAAAKKPVKINRWLPYWAVFQADVRQTLQSWLYRTWVIMSLLAAAGYLLFNLGAFHLSGLIRSDANLVSDLLKWTVIGSVTLVIILTAGCISSERGTMADSVLSRGISRYQYFMGKWHARLVTVIGSFLLMALLWLVAIYFLLPQEEIQISGALVALLTVASVLAVVVTLGVSVSAMTNSTVLGIAVLWMGLYGASFLLSLMPHRVVSLDVIMERMPHVLRGNYDFHSLSRILLGALGICVVSAGVGMTYFARRDV